ncbi:hypothetical protein P170DRAFT_464271 [Aspergillus steynii IBT 23096]|uniref:F-box domain-containing protein n=1 Tax=Aspergillus steynii IBT 23096 TaxID=1392250 RepID=A0A2I2GEP4_9EURO|nr:uncharacterized protein P170DRAFT_464271 [Aspergillus steynii IBT 23096]PLB51354.1 hypothetical protein P170DRAFT_464271 [Aspergillus steynii IBT 23096]
MDQTFVKQSTLCTLPIECRQAILCYLPDMHALKAAVLSHPAMYSAFIDRDEWILSRIMGKVIPGDLLPDAIFEYSSSALENDSWTRERVLNLIEQHGAHHVPSSFKWTPGAAFHMQTFYRHVRFFTLGFVDSAFEVYPALQGRAVSSPEWCRMARSFYRVEIYRHLFRRRDHVQKKPSPDFPYHEQTEIYYERFAAFELEQLACVSEYLFRKVLTPFNEIAAHDIVWASKAVGYSMTEPWQSFNPATRIGNVISQGLAFLHGMLTAETYEKRYQLLTPNISRVNTFLPNALWFLFPRDEGDTELLRDYDSEELALYTTPEAPESDPGPVEVWRQAHLDKTLRDFVYSMDMREKRRWGYALWDYGRLAQLEVFDRPFTRAPTPDYGEAELLEAVTGSLVTRWKLWWKGARGWWSEEDQSQVRWEGHELDLSDEELELEGFHNRVLL